MAKCLLKLNTYRAPLKTRLSNFLPTNSPTRALNIILIHALGRNLGYSDTSLASDPTTGVNVVGATPRTIALTKRRKPDRRIVSRLPNGPAARTNASLGCLKRARRSCLTQKFWELPLGERKKGWLSEPTQAADWGRRNDVLSPRYCISGQRGAQAAKFLLIDDLSMSKANETFSTVGKYCPQDIDHFVALTRLQLKTGAWAAGIRPVDFPHAYKAIAIREDTKSGAYARFANPENVCRTRRASSFSHSGASVPLRIGEGWSLCANSSR